jgi:hypothetical protein
MNQHSRAFISAMMQKGHDSRIVEILFANVISDLNAEMSGAHAPGQFLAGGVDILQGHLTK